MTQEPVQIDIGLYYILIPSNSISTISLSTEKTSLSLQKSNGISELMYNYFDSKIAMTNFIILDTSTRGL